MASIYWRNGVAYLNWRQNGERHRRSLGKISPTEAETTRQAKELELRTGQKLLSTGQLFEDFAERYLAWYETEYPASYERTQGIINNHLEVFMDYCLDQITPYQIESWKSDRLKNAARATVRKELNVLNAMFNRAMAWRWLDSNPVKDVTKPKPVVNRDPIWYTTTQLNNLYAVSKDRANGWQFMANTGLRRKEAVQLSPTDIRDGAVYILSHEEARTKSGKYRHIPLSPAASEAFKAMGKTGWWFSHYTVYALSRAFKRDALKAGIPGSIHSLRHTFAAHLAQQGVPLRVIQLLMGHASIKTTEIYSHLCPDNPRDAVKILQL